VEEKLRLSVMQTTELLGAGGRPAALLHHFTSKPAEASQRASPKIGAPEQAESGAPPSRQQNELVI
jgi:hypothetical protein